MAIVEARGLRKIYRDAVALDGIDLRVEEGRVLGIVGPNGAGKSTALHAILGLLPFEGTLRVLGRDPWVERDALMRDVCFIADVAILPRWIRVDQALDYVAGVHPRFDRAKAQAFLDRSGVRHTSKVRELSKGLAAQVHLAIVMAIDARLLVLDEPTLGLDLLASRTFYDSLIHDYFDRTRTVIVTTHQIDELQDVLTDVVFLDRGRIVLESAMDAYESRFFEVLVTPDRIGEARALGPIHERQALGRTVLTFDRADRERLEALGEVRTPSIAELFVAVVAASQESGR